jgi:hypothetical protein
VRGRRPDRGRSLHSCRGGAAPGWDGGAPAAASVGRAPSSAAPEPAGNETTGKEAGSARAGDASSAGPGGGAGDTRTMGVIAALVKTHRKEARECYEKGLKQIPGLKGDVVVHFTLKPSGQVKQIDLNRDRSTITEASVVTCVLDVVRSIEFPRSSKGMEAVVNYPFNFNP